MTGSERRSHTLEVIGKQGRMGRSEVRCAWNGGCDRDERGASEAFRDRLKEPATALPKEGRFRAEAGSREAGEG